MTAPRLDHWGQAVSSREELDALYERTQRYREKDDRVDIVDLSEDSHPGVTIHAFYVRYLLPADDRDPVLRLGPDSRPHASEPGTDSVALSNGICTKFVREPDRSRREPCDVGADDALRALAENQQGLVAVRQAYALGLTARWSSAIASTAATGNASHPESCDSSGRPAPTSPPPCEPSSITGPMLRLPSSGTGPVGHTRFLRQSPFT